MKKDIHPKVFNATITCACGNQEQVLSTKGEEVHVEVCSACHPFFTGKQRFLDTAAVSTASARSTPNLKRSRRCRASGVLPRVCWTRTLSHLWRRRWNLWFHAPAGGLAFF